MSSRNWIGLVLLALVGCGDASGSPQTLTCESVTPDWAWSAAPTCTCEETEASAYACGTCAVRWRNDKGVQQSGEFEGTCENVACCATPPAGK